MNYRTWSAAATLLATICLDPAVGLGQAPNLLIITPGVTAIPATALGSTVTFDLRISNPGSTSVTISGYGVSGRNASDFVMTSNYCPTTLGPYSACDQIGNFTPGAIGLRIATVVVTDVGGAPQSVIVSGEGVAATEAVSFTPAEVTFPASPIGLTQPNAPSAYVQVRNAGTASLNIQAVSVTGANAGDFVITSNSCSAQSIAPGAFCPVNLSFLPMATGIRNGSLQITDNTPQGMQSLPLSGVGSAAENLLQFSPADLAFPPAAINFSESNQLMLQNTGTNPVTINSFTFSGPNAPDFSLLQNSCKPLPYTLAVLAQCALQVQFTPAAAGSRLATLNVADSATGSPQAIPLEGTGVLSTLNLSFGYNPLNFGAAQVGVPASSSLSVTNMGIDTVQLSVGISGMDATDFGVTSACPSPLGPGESCYPSLSFTPGAPGIRLSTLVVSDSISGLSQSVALAGMGESAVPSLTVYGPNFTPQTVGSTSNLSTVTLSNNSSSPLTITGYSISGTASSDFNLFENNCPTVLNNFSTCFLQMTFAPSALGTRIAELTITYTGGTGPLVIPLAGAGVTGSAALSFSPAYLDFGPQTVGTPSSATATITSTGTAATAITKISVAGVNAPDYSINTDSCPRTPATLLPGATCQVDVQFTPSALGSRAGSLSLVSDAAGSPQSLALVGFGSNASPVLYVNPNVLNFNPLPLGSSAQQSIGLATSYGMSVSLTGVQITGPNAGDFTLVNGCPPTLSSTPCNVYVTFTPSVTGLRVAELQILDNATGSPQIIPLGGMGSTAALSVSLTPNPVAFQPQAIHSTSTVALTINNTGNEGILLSGFHFGGPHKNDFGIQTNNCPLAPTPLAAGASCQVTVAFTPAATGVRIATFGLTDNASGSPQSIMMIGEGVPDVKMLQITPTSLTYNPTPVGTPSYGYVTIYNIGNLPVTFQSFSITGANQGDFLVLYTDCTQSGSPILNAGSNCYVNLTFTPSTTGPRVAQLNIDSDATGSPQVIPLSGTGE